MHLASDALNPAADGAARIAEEMRSVLAQLICVRGIALFGSLAEDRADRWSDVDMLVACESVGADAWAAASAIRSAKPVLFYRRFGAAAPPSGRFWFDGESVFHKLDISFHSPEEYAARLEGAEHGGHSIKATEVYHRTSITHSPTMAECVCQAEPASDLESRIGSHIYFSLRALKRSMRGTRLNETDMDGISGLRDALKGLPRCAVMSGGNVGELAYRVGEMLEESGLVTSSAQAASSK